MDRPAAMAGDGGHGSCSVADRLAAAWPPDARFLVLSAEQPALGNLGLVRQCLGADRSADLSGVDEHSWREEERWQCRKVRSSGGKPLNCQSAIAVYTPKRRGT